jgi:hypothetical protein
MFSKAKLVETQIADGCCSAWEPLVWVEARAFKENKMRNNHKKAKTYG